MICPEGVFCDGDEDSQIWLCYDDDGIKTCIGYGLSKNMFQCNYSNQDR